jgi:S1-C subfamily serine protease
VPASRILVNSPGAQGVCGITSGLDPSFTLGCGTFGGNSGGPVFNSRGEFVGTIWGGISGYSNLAFAIPNHHACTRLASVNLLY